MKLMLGSRRANIVLEPTQNSRVTSPLWIWNQFRENRPEDELEGDEHIRLVQHCWRCHAVSKGGLQQLSGTLKEVDTRIDIVKVYHR